VKDYQVMVCIQEETISALLFMNTIILRFNDSYENITSVTSHVQYDKFTKIEMLN